MTGNPELTRRGWLGLLGAAGGLTALGAAEVATGIPSDDWTVLALPATQFYAENLDGEIEYAHDQTRWDADHVGAEDVAFVTHEGDLVEDGGRGEEWDRIAAVMDRLDGRVPYSTPPGNHDGRTTTRTTSRRTPRSGTSGPTSGRRAAATTGSRGSGASARMGGRSANLNAYRTFSAAYADIPRS